MSDDQGTEDRQSHCRSLQASEMVSTAGYGRTAGGARSTPSTCPTRRALTQFIPANTNLTQPEAYPNQPNESSFLNDDVRSFRECALTTRQRLARYSECEWALRCDVGDLPAGIGLQECFGRQEVGQIYWRSKSVSITFSFCSQS